MNTEPTPTSHDTEPPFRYVPAQFVPNTPAVRSTSGLAITALVLGLVGGAILAVIFGHIALADVRKHNKDGKGMAVAGLVLGYVETVFWVLLIVLAIAAASSAGGYA